jgi:hypothetical protein
MAAHTHYLWFTTRKRQEILDITDEVAEQGRVGREAAEAGGDQGPGRALTRPGTGFGR